ncbi:RnfH family protein [Salinispirillum marinum]|uniref:UPF0125 protein ACFOSD_01440 n=2 Tax=Saccharospirillaceae TaxID=255527 RepID=A0ABV8BCR4_9GAMM
MADLRIEVAYALPEKQKILSVCVSEGTTYRQAVQLSRIQEEFPDEAIMEAPLGVFGKKVANPETAVVKDGERIEIYRPLLIDPKQARANRAARASK